MRIVKTYDQHIPALSGFVRWVEDYNLTVHLAQRDGEFIATLKNKWRATGAKVEFTTSARLDTICRGIGNTEYDAIYDLSSDILSEEVVFFSPGCKPYKIIGNWRAGKYR